MTTRLDVLNNIAGQILSSEQKSEFQADVAMGQLAMAENIVVGAIAALGDQRKASAFYRTLADAPTADMRRKKLRA